jgi:hypothetical protein
LDLEAIRISASGARWLSARSSSAIAEKVFRLLRRRAMDTRSHVPV